ncbi:MAG: hypothetical protein ACKO34_04840 [Vampirovibrionales bacterium]
MDTVLKHALLPLGALGLGMLHMLEPGHGKLAIVTYLLQHRLRWIHTLGFGLMAGVSHSVTLLLVLTVAMQVVHRFPKYEASLLQGLQVLSALLIVGIGVVGVIQAWRLPPASQQNDCTQTHLPKATETHSPVQALYVLAWASGMRPCPRSIALLMMLLHTTQWQLNVQMLEYCLLFSIGMGVVVWGLCMMVQAGKVTLGAMSHRLQARWPHWEAWLQRGLSLVLLGCGLVFVALSLGHQR